MSNFHYKTSRLTAEIAETLALTKYEQTLLNTPLKHLTKEQKAEAIKVDSRVFTEIDRLKDIERALEKPKQHFE